MKKKKSVVEVRLRYLLVIENRLTADRQGCLSIYEDSEEEAIKVAMSVAETVKKATASDITLYKPIKEW